MKVNLLSRGRRSRALTLLIVFMLIGFVLIVYLLATSEKSLTRSGSYIYTDNSQVEWLSWKSENNGRLTGQWNGVSYQLPLTNSSQPSVSQLVSLTGTENNGTVQLTGGTLSFQGTVSNSSLKIPTTNSSGQVMDQTWVTASQQDYNSLVMVFNTSMHLEGTLTDLGNDVQFPTDDSNPASLDNTVKQAQQYMTLLHGKVARIQAVPSHSAQCQQLDLLAQYYPASPETFQLPYQPGTSHLAKDLNTIASLWKQAQQQAYHIAGLNPPWAFTQVKLNSAVAPGQKAYTVLQTTYQRGQQTMLQLQQDYQSVGDTIRSLEQACS